jgi:transcription elongation GreA/GreB family factor
VDPEAPSGERRRTFGATVRCQHRRSGQVVSVGADEVDLDQNFISWVSPWPAR